MPILDGLHPDHLADLRKSGLTDETIAAAKIYSVRPADINKKLGMNLPWVESVMAFPYPGCDESEVYKIFPSRNGLKYIQPKGTQSRVYFPPPVREILSNQSIPIYGTEGVKKALKSTQEGVPCFALSGLWNWSDGSEEKKLIPYFDLINLDGRTIYFTPDNDWELPNRHGEQRNLRQAVYELAYRLIDRGAKVYVIELPPGPLKGVDDYLCQHSIEDFHSLPKREIKKQTIEEMIQAASLENLRDIIKRLAGLHETERAVHVNALAKKLNVSKRAIQKDIDGLTRGKTEPTDIDRLLEGGGDPASRYSAQNFIDDVLSFGAIIGGERLLVQSNGEILFEDGESFRFNRTSITAEAVRRYRAGDDVIGADLINRIQGLLIDHVVFKDDRLPTLLAVWIVGTYFYKIFRFYGYIWVNSPVKRCAKSLVLEIISLIAFNSTTRLVNPSSSFLFREVDRNDRTLVIDEVESLGAGDKEQKAEIMGLLNGGFQSGSQVPRMESKNKEFVVAYFNAYSPKALAGIKTIVDTIEDRSFKIPMIRKKRTEKVKRFNLRALDSFIEKIKEDCFVWALRYAGDVSEVYREGLDWKGTENLDDRMRDILEPLLSIAAVVDTQAGGGELAKTLISVSKDIGRGREDQEALNGSVPAVVSVMKSLVDGADEKFVSADELFGKFKEDEDLGWIESKRGLAFFLAKLELPRIRKGSGKETVRGYKVQRAWIDDLEQRYA
ncbi:MAG: DUF3854 domain-containing protein [Deltaproteobacteria bacterium]|nr:DUF3854 domain-containing protein [Deltaproteobacteria bacterium]